MGNIESRRHPWILLGNDTLPESAKPAAFAVKQLFVVWGHRRDSAIDQSQLLKSLVSDNDFIMLLIVRLRGSFRLYLFSILGKNIAETAEDQGIAALAGENQIIAGGLRAFVKRVLPFTDAVYDSGSVGNRSRLPKR